MKSSAICKSELCVYQHQAINESEPIEFDLARMKTPSKEGQEEYGKCVKGDITLNNN